jgi:RNA polymerase sigma-70 factor (ECF subfamily)
MEQDSVLLARVREGDRKAFGELVSNHKTTVFSTIYSIIGNTQEAEDIAQEVFINAYTAAGSFKGKSSFSTWLYSVTVNKCMDYLRERKRKEYYEVELDKEERLKLKELTMNSVASTYQNTERQELQEIIQKVLNSLPEKYRVILVLREIEELSYQEIAHVMKVSVNKVKVLLFRARQKMKEKLLPVYQEVI